MPINSISIQQPFIQRHHVDSAADLAQEKNKAAQLFVAYIFEKSLNQVLSNNQTTETGDKLSSGSLLAKQQMNAEIAKIVAQSSSVTKSIASQLK